MKFFALEIDKIIIRYYLMMAAVIAPFMLGVPLLAILAVPIFLSALMGIKFEFGVKESKAMVSAKIRKVGSGLFAPVKKAA